MKKDRIAVFNSATELLFMGSDFNRQVRHWLLAIRPKTLGISLAPVLVGSALAWSEQQELHWLPALAALIAALLIQIGTNLHNDAADFERGADTHERLGPKRATAQGWFTAAAVKRAAKISFSLAFLTGIYLAMIGGWPIIIIGLLSLTAGYAYTGGPRPIAYSASGELFVFIFFGLFAVMGSYYIQTLSLSLNIFFSACAVGFLAAAVLLVNNYRDLDSDVKASKFTLTNYLGRKNSRYLYMVLLLVPFTLPMALQTSSDNNWLILSALPLALLLLYRLTTLQPGPVFNQILAHTAQLQLLFSALLSVSLII
ncbi:1,4-dihydroxy-2-naphthoate polyprenyltransferase [Candidatus Vondammii sp. HM_W22]|uniref:1,4-dihydroxy-2-naphthoate polyprenyltransferase n=1 Tax=Candidatus Vondammii sp. HM_W22 TaxID=2687299 RepID=UPI002E7B4CB5|nr:1,4-dihydroxy-2-naphthoate polyprenyltransferase [Candidatus Vondammii sp. HM_W22]